MSDAKASSYNDNPFGLGQAYIDMAHKMRQDDLDELQAQELHVEIDPATRHQSPCEEQ